MLDSFFVHYSLRTRGLVCITLIALCVLWFSWGCLAEEVQSIEKGEVKSLLTRLEEASATMESFEASFVQEKELSLFAETMIFQGRLVVVRPDKLRWEFTDPLSSVLMLTGDKGLRCSGETKPVQFDLKTDPVMRSVAEQLWLWLGGDYSRLEKSFSIEENGENSLLIRPKESAMTEYIEQVTITFEHINMQPERVVIMEPGGDQTRLIFSDYSFNIEPDDQVFTRCAP